MSDIISIYESCAYLFDKAGWCWISHEDVGILAGPIDKDKRVKIRGNYVTVFINQEKTVYLDMLSLIGRMEPLGLVCCPPVMISLGKRAFSPHVAGVMTLDGLLENFSRDKCARLILNHCVRHHALLPAGEAIVKENPALWARYQVHVDDLKTMAGELRDALTQTG